MSHSNILRDLMTTNAGIAQNVAGQSNVEAKSTSKALRYVTVVPGPETVANLPAGSTPQTQYVIVEFDEDVSNMPQDKIASLINSVTTQGSTQGQTIQQQNEHMMIPIEMQAAQTMTQEMQQVMPDTLIIAEKPAVVEHTSNDFRCTFDQASGTFLYRCTKCFYSTLFKDNLIKHRRKHSFMKPFQCKSCTYRCTTSGNLKRHQAIHTNERAHTCNLCGYKFRQKIHMLRHIKYKHQEKTVCCPLCKYVCANEKPDLQVHMKRHHSAPVDDGLVYSCPLCLEVSSTLKDLKQHLKVHKSGPELKIKCDKCSFVTDCNSRFKRHTRVHTKERPYACSLCQYSASQKEHVIRHMRTKHSMGNLPIPAKKIRSNGRRRVNLDGDGLESARITEKIVKSINSMDLRPQEKVFGCNHCSMKFTKLINLYKHLYSMHAQLMPDQETNFNCIVCEFHTTSKKNLLTHMRKHNLRDQSIPTHVYTCVLCTYVNARRRNLLQHMKKKHSIDITTESSGAVIMTLPESAMPQGAIRTMELEAPQPIGSALSKYHDLFQAHPCPVTRLADTSVTSVTKPIMIAPQPAVQTKHINIAMPNPVPIQSLMQTQQFFH